MMTVAMLSERYFTLWMSAPSASGIEQAASDVMAALETSTPYAVIDEKWKESWVAVISAENLGDAPAQVYHEQKLSVYTQFLSEVRGVTGEA